MKKKVIISIIIFLLFKALVYSGIFRDNTNPLEVTKYYYECQKNIEWPLMYQIYKKGCFTVDKITQDCSTYKLNSIDKIKPTVLENKNYIAVILVEITYKNRQAIYSIVELEKLEGIWLIKNVRYLNTISNA